MSSLDRKAIQALKQLSESIAGQESDSVSTVASSASSEASTSKQFAKFMATAETDSVGQSLGEMVTYFMQGTKEHKSQPCWTMVRQGRHMKDSQSGVGKKAKPKEGVSFKSGEKWNTWGQLPWWIWKMQCLQFASNWIQCWESSRRKDSMSNCRSIWLCIQRCFFQRNILRWIQIALKFA